MRGEDKQAGRGGGEQHGGDMSSLKTSQVIGKVETMGNVMVSSSQKKKDGKEKTSDH